MNKVLVSEAMSAYALDTLRTSLDVCFYPELWDQPEKLAAEIVDTRALIVRNQTQVTAELIERAKPFANHWPRRNRAGQYRHGCSYRVWSRCGLHPTPQRGLCCRVDYWTHTGACQKHHSGRSRHKSGGLESQQIHRN